MLKIDNFEVMGWEHVIRGMRNPLNSWDRSDSRWLFADDDGGPDYAEYRAGDPASLYFVGNNDHDLMMRLRNAGTDHRKFMRMITVYLDITAPLYWWKEFDTYKVGTVANSCSTMHKIAEKKFMLEDFSHERLIYDWKEEDPDSYFEYPCQCENDAMAAYCSLDVLMLTIEALNANRKAYLKATEKLKRNDLTISERKHITAQQKLFWWQMIQLLPSSYNQKRTVMLNYEVLANIYKSRKDHKLDEWHTFCHWIEELPYSEIIIGGYLDEEKPDLSKIPICNEIMEEAKRRVRAELIKDEWPRSSSIIASPMYKAKDLKKYRIDCGHGIVYLVTPYDPEERFPVLANTCFGLRKTWERCDILDVSTVEEDDYERLTWGGDEYIWRMDGARRMVTPNPDKEWDMDYCEKCKKE